MTRTDGIVTEELTKKTERIMRVQLLGEMVDLSNNIEDYEAFKKTLLTMLIEATKPPKEQ